MEKSETHIFHNFKIHKLRTLVRFRLSFMQYDANIYNPFMNCILAEVYQWHYLRVIERERIEKSAMPRDKPGTVPLNRLALKEWLLVVCKRCMVPTTWPRHFGYQIDTIWFNVCHFHYIHVDIRVHSTK